MRSSVIVTLLAITLVAVCGSVVNAAQVSYSDSFPVTTTNWNGLLTVPLFNPALGTLTSIDFVLSGNVSGSIRLESLDNSPTTVLATLAATLTLTRPDMSTIVVTIPTFSTTDNFSAFDGVIDFGGTSGASHGPVTNGATNSATSPPPASDLALFTGVGNISLPISAVGNSTASGSGNLVTIFQTSADATVDVTYHYNVAQVPAPATSLLLGVGLLGAGLLTRRRISR